MKDPIIASVGTGNMGMALLRGLIASKRYPASKLRAADVNKEKLAELAAELKIKTFTDNTEAVQGADVVLLAVKPQILDSVLREIKDHLNPEALLLSVAAGFPTASIERIVGGKPHVVRSMPNIAATVGMSATALCAGRYSRPHDLKLAGEIFTTCGTVTTVDEGLMDAVTGLSGSGPMYIFIIIEALADAGVRVGLSRKQATELAVQTVMGAAHMVRETGQHPIVLKDLVTSPAGTAITALYTMEKTGFRAVLMDAVAAAATRSGQLGAVYAAE
jgi:pyrroline-5-carboxylate reductase